MDLNRRSFVAGSVGTMVGSVLSYKSLAQESTNATVKNNEGREKTMSDITLQAGSLSLHLDTKGGTITGFWYKKEGVSQPVALLRPMTDGTPSCFPLVPFGNRVKDNHFRFEGRDYTLQPNIDLERHYVHGEGWLADWSIVEQQDNYLIMQFEHQSGDAGYNYQARQIFSLFDDLLEMKLEVKNIGGRAMPFGLGWHPYFPVSPNVTLWAPVQKFWTEVDDFLPGDVTLPPAELDFSQPKTLPQRWVNNGLQDWIGKAVISWPQQRVALHLEADPLFRHAFIFVPGEGAPPNSSKYNGFGEGYFCFEPMSHLANGHNLEGLGGLVSLSPGEELSGSIRFYPQVI